jgi:hypothetical protein
VKREVALIVVEGDLEVPVAKRVLDQAGVDYAGARILNQRGRTKFWPNVARYNAAAASLGVVFALADLEEVRCAPMLLKRHLRKKTHHHFICRIAVRALESWLLADREQFAEFLNAPFSKLPANPDALTHPKKTVIELARRHAPDWLKRDLVPEEGSAGIAGRGYNSRIVDFVIKSWNPRDARTNSHSLDRAIRAIERVFE